MQGEVKAAKRILGVFAHPDDPEFFSGGTFAKWASEGAEIVFVVATSGDKGSADPDMTGERLATIREAEERAAAKALGVKDVVFLRFKDGELTPSLELRREVVRQIRIYKPDVVVTLDPTVFWRGDASINHPDHRAIGEATLGAVYPIARDRLNYPEMEVEEKLETHKVKQVYIAGTATPNVKIDITHHLDTKLNSLREHKSQIADFDGLVERMKKNTDPESPDYPRYVESFRVLTFER